MIKIQVKLTTTPQKPIQKIERPEEDVYENINLVSFHQSVKRLKSNYLIVQVKTPSPDALDHHQKVL